MATMNTVMRYLPRVLLKNISAFRVCRHCSSLHGANTPKKKFLLAAAVCVERHPVITKDKTDLLSKFSELYNTIELEGSSLSDHELKAIKESKKGKTWELIEDDAAETKAKGKKKKKESIGVELSVKDLEYQWEEELVAMKLADRQTEADLKNDMKSVHRHLDRKLILLVRHTLGEDQWMLPQGVHTEGETLRETAERTLKDRCGLKLESDFLGNAPCGHYIQKFPDNVQQSEGTIGVKIFFYKARYKKGQVEFNSDDVKDFMWVTLDELPKYVGQQYGERLLKFIVEFP